MKIRNLLLTIPILFLIIGMGGCEKEKTSNLKGSTWQLTGYVNAFTGETVKATPEGDGYYTFTFDTDNTAIGGTIINSIAISLSRPYIHVLTKIDDSINGNAHLFYEAIESIEFYDLDGDQLKFFYDNKKQYLLFEKR